MMPKRWHKVFEERRDLMFGFDNEFFIEKVEQGLDVLEDFTPGLTGSGTCAPRKNLLQDFCGPIRIDNVLSGHGQLEKAALLIDGAFHGPRMCSRSDYGPLDAHQLYELLRKPRFDSRRCVCDGAPTEDTVHQLEGSNSSEDVVRVDDGHPNAERRVIYINDIDPHFLIALIATVSFHQAEPLQNILYRHLASEAYIGISNTTGLLMFELAFHLPFWALREAPKGQNPHPKAWDVSFLSGSDTTSLYICPARYSCGVVGTDQWHWIAYCLVDTYFDGSDERRESAHSHYEDAVGLDDFPLDPAGDNTFTSENLGPDPRCWFLTVLAVRLSKAVEEWRQFVSQLTASMEETEVKYPPAMGIFHQRFSAVSKWLHQFQRLATKAANTLSQVVRACQKLFERFGGEFDAEEHELRRTAYCTIADRTEALESINTELQGLIIMCHDYIRTLGSCMDSQQREVARDNKTVSLILLLCTPVVITTAIFSMDDSILKKTLPSLPITPTSFFTLLTGLSTFIGCLALQQRLIQLPQRLLDLHLNHVVPNIRNFWPINRPATQAGRNSASRFDQRRQDEENGTWRAPWESDLPGFNLARPPQAVLPHGA